MISRDHARNIASEWHGGQASHLYSFASTGELFSDNRRAKLYKDGYLSEITTCQIETARSDDEFSRARIVQLQKLWTYIAVNVEDPDDDYEECCYGLCS